MRGTVTRRRSLKSFATTLGLVAMTMLGGAPIAGAAIGGTLDLTVADLEINQGFKTTLGQLVAGRTTWVRGTVGVAGSASAVAGVDGLLEVFIDGVEAPFSPVFSLNGPITASLTPNLNNLNDTLNFGFIAPQEGSVEFVFRVNPAGPNSIPETDTANNRRRLGPITFVKQRVIELAYAPINLLPGGGPPNIPGAGLIRPGVGDNFIQAIYPSADWNYHRIDAPWKLWNSSVSSSSGGSALNVSLVADLNLMSPKPDFIYGWAPGALPGYNGVSTIPGVASMGNTEVIRHQRTFAHEVGHNFGLSHITVTQGKVGIDVEHHLAITQSLPVIKGSTLNDIMTPGLLTPQAWIWNNTYNFLFNHSVFDFTDTESADAGDTPMMMIGGLLDRATGTVKITNTLAFTGGVLSQPSSMADADVVIRSYSNGTLVHELPLAVKSSLDEGGCALETDSGEPMDPIVGFLAVVPVFPSAPVDRVDVVNPATSADGPAVQLLRSSNAPQIEFTSPSETTLNAAELTVAWNGFDADADDLRYTLRYSPNGENMVPLLTSDTATEYTVDLSELPGLVDGVGYFELFASDGLNTTVIKTAPLSSGSEKLGLGSNPPRVDVLTPDSGTSFLKGAAVILHSSGWDLEDKAINGTALTWSSNLDGPLGTGRLFAVTNLSVGEHVITVTATDSSLLMATADTLITIVDRLLPNVGTVCQADLGFGGPGTTELMICGGDLSSGTTAGLTITGAPASELVLILAGFSLNPTPKFGGTVVPLPAAITVFLTTDTSGNLAIPGIPGGGGPLTVYVQAVVNDPGQVNGASISNALQVDLLP
jgi:hypothetical protein